MKAAFAKVAPHLQSISIHFFNRPMNTKKILISFFALTLASNCLSAESKQDALCTELVNFANATDDDALHVVELRTDWSFRKVDNRIFMGRKECDHQEYAPGKALCGYLLKNTSTEFPIINFKRALTCLENSPQLSNTSVEQLKIKLWTYQVKDVKPKLRVGLEFTEGGKNTLPSLKILVEKQP